MLLVFNCDPDKLRFKALPSIPSVFLLLIVNLMYLNFFIGSFFFTVCN